MMANETVSSKIDTVVKILWEFYDYFHGSDKDYLLIILYAPTVLVGVIANIFVIIVVCKYHLKSVTNYFVVNLSVADLLVAIICMPMTISQEISMSWNHSEFLCKLTSYLQTAQSLVFAIGVGVTASVYTIMAMCIDRYLAIRNPMILRCVCSHRNIILVIVAIWMASMAFFITMYGAMRFHNPMKEIINKTLDLIASENFSLSSISPIPPDFNMCTEDFASLGIRRDVLGSVYFLFSIAIPCLVVLLAYSMIGFTLWSRKPPFDCDNRESASSRQGSRLRHDRKRVALILLFLAILFALCWMPYNIVKYLIDLDVIDLTTSINNTLKYFLFLGHANSALNPVVYCWMTRGFRKNLAKILHCVSNNLSVSHHDPSRRNAIADDNVPIYERKLTRMRYLAERRRKDFMSYYQFFPAHSSRPHQYNLRRINIELRNICDVSNVQINLSKNDDRRDQQQNKDKNALEISQPESSSLCTINGRR